MKLNVLERLLILNLDTLPAVGNIATLKIKQKLIMDVGFSEDELRNYDIRPDGDRIKWDTAKAQDVEIEIGEQGLKLLLDALEKSESLNDTHLALYDKLREASGPPAPPRAES